MLYKISDWNQSQWNFTGYDVGPVSNDLYHLLSSSDKKQWAIIRKKTDGTDVWAKLYETQRQCATIKIDANEEKAYFGSDESGLALGIIKCSDGALSGYQEIGSKIQVSEASTRINITPDKSKLLILGYNNENSGFICLINTLNLKPYWYTSFKGSKQEVIINSDTKLTLVYKDYVGIIFLDFYDFNFETIQSNRNSMLYFNDYSSIALNFKLGSDSDHLYLANDVKSNDFIYLHVLSKSDNEYITWRQRPTSFESQISSLQIETNSVIWIGVSSISSQEAELIRYDIEKEEYRIFQIKGFNLFYSYIYGSNTSAWYLLARTKYSYLVSLTSIYDVSGLNVTELNNSGFNEEIKLRKSDINSKAVRNLYSQSVINEKFIGVSDLKIDIICTPVIISTNTDKSNATSLSTSNNTYSLSIDQSTSDDSIDRDDFEDFVYKLKVSTIITLLTIILIMIAFVCCCRKRICRNRATSKKILQ